VTLAGGPAALIVTGACASWPTLRSAHRADRLGGAVRMGQRAALTLGCDVD
jgi:hypothetical protein